MPDQGFVRYAAEGCSWHVCWCMLAVGCLAPFRVIGWFQLPALHAGQSLCGCKNSWCINTKRVSTRNVLEVPLGVWGGGVQMHQVKAVLLMHGRQAVVRVSIHSNWNTRGYTTSTLEISIAQYSKEGC